MVGTRVSPKVRLELMILADEMGMDTAALLRALIHILLRRAGRIGPSAPEYLEEQGED